MNVSQAGSERTAEEYEQAARDEVHGAVAQASEMSIAEIRERMTQTWNSHRAEVQGSLGCGRPAPVGVARYRGRKNHPLD